MTKQELFIALDTDGEGNLIPLRDQKNKFVILTLTETQDAIAANFPFTFAKLEDVFLMIFRNTLPKTEKPV